MPYIADRVQETTTTTGIAGQNTPIVLGGAVSGYRSFAAGFGSGSISVQYLITNGTAWEVGKGTFNGTTGLTRDILESSSTGNFIALSGVSNVYCTVGAELLKQSGNGPQYAKFCGYALP